MLRHIPIADTTDQAVPSNLKINIIKVLSIDNNSTDALFLKQILAKDKRKKFEIEQVNRLKDGIKCLRRKKFDAILLNLFLPDSYGIQTIKEVLAISRIPIVVLIDKDNEKIAGATLKEGAQDCLLKDELYPSLLSRTIQYAIERQQISEQLRQTISSLHESEQRFRIIANTASVLIWMSDNNGQCIFFNQPWLDFTGRSLKTQLTIGWIEDVHIEDRERCLNLYQEALANQDRFQVEYRLLRADGQYRWMFSNVVPRFDTGKFSGYVSSCIDISKRKQAETILDRQIIREKLFSEITKHIHESLDLLSILETTAREINQFLGADKIAIFKNGSEFNCQLLLETFAPEFALSCQIGLTSSQKMPQEARDNFERLAQGKIVVISSQESVSEFPESRYIEKAIGERIYSSCQSEEKDLSTDALLLIPIILEKQLWGLLCIQHFSSLRQWQVFEIDLLEQLATQLAIAVQQSELYQQLQAAKDELEKLVVIDSLTGVANRRKFDRYIDSEWRRLAREKSPLSLILCDIDYFKNYNDTYGHQSGDRCLQQVAQAISRAIKRPADLVTRYGGEEFAIILPNTEVEGATQVAEIIRRSVKELRIAHITSNIDLCVTLSLGVAGFVPSNDLPPATLITTADQALYDAKKQGRDRVVSSLFR